jgi:hypothetical protein
MALGIGTAVYLLNCAIGLMAQLGRRKFGAWHHVAYALVCVTAVAALVWAYHPALWLTALALVLFPRARPHTIWHPALAVLGLLGYLGAWASPEGM